MRVLRAFQTHYPSYFKGKTEKDKDLLIAEYQSLYRDVDDRIFLVAAGRIVRTSSYFPNDKEIQEMIQSVQIEASRKELDRYYQRRWIKEKAELTDDQCQRMIDIELIFEFKEPLDWFKIREEAREQITNMERSEIDGKELRSRKALEGEVSEGKDPHYGGQI